MSKQPDPRDLYGHPDDYWRLITSKPLYEAAKAMYGRLALVEGHKKRVKFHKLDIDEIDHYVIAAQHAIRAFHRTAETAEED